MKLAPLFVLLTANALGTATLAADLPAGGVVAAGTASIATGANSLVVTQGSNRAIINWNSFSVGAGNTVQFVQPSTSSAVLNRVVTANPSQIYGSITANGRVFLVNPNGIVVGPTGKIDASGIFLTTASIGDSDFMAGNLLFEAPPATTPIVIEGQLKAKYVLNLYASTTEIREGAVLDAHRIDVNTEPFSELVELTITDMSATSRTYDGTTVAGLTQGTLNGLVAGDALSFTGQTGAFVDRNAGIAKAVVVSGITLTDNGAGLASNYTVRNPTGLTADITPARLPGGPISEPQTYDGGTGGSLSLIGGEGLTLTGGMAGNYNNLTFPAGNLSSYGNLTLAGGSLSTNSGNLTLSGAVPSGNISLSGGNISLTAASGTTIPTGGGDLTLTAGTFAITGSNAGPGSITTGGGNITVAGSSPGGSLSLASGSLAVATETRKLLQQTAGAISLRGAASVQPAAPTPIAATATAPVPLRATTPTARLVNTGSLVDGAVTVRLSLVDASPISLR